MPLNENLLYFKKDAMFTQSKICKLYKVSDENPSGERMHYHDYMQIWYVLKGICENIVEGTKHVLSKDDVFIIPRKKEHTTIPLKNSEIICCEFSYEYFFNMSENTMFKDLYNSILSFSSIYCFLCDSPDLYSGFKLRPEISELIKSRMKYMLSEYTKCDLYFEQLISAEIINMLIIISREYKKSPICENITILHEKYRPLVENAIEYIDTNYNKPLKLEDVCKISMISKTYFCYLFKMITNRTFVEYLIDVRIQKAVELLKHPQNSITWVGFEVGFNDSTHFSRTFRKVQGMSPRAYRIMHF